MNWKNQSDSSRRSRLPACLPAHLHGPRDQQKQSQDARLRAKSENEKV